MYDVYAHTHIRTWVYAHIRTQRVVHMKRKANMSIEEDILYKIDKKILDTQIFSNRSEMFEYFSYFLDYFDESFKSLPVEKTIEKMYEKIHGSNLASPTVEKIKLNQSEKCSENKKINNINISHKLFCDTFPTEEMGVEELEIRSGISNFTGGFFK